MPEKKPVYVDGQAVTIIPELMEDQTQYPFRFLDSTCCAYRTVNGHLVIMGKMED